MKRIVIGMTAHVDSGKTTLSEAMMFRCGEIRKLGRVDHGNAFLDTYEIERKRGITVFAKQAIMRYEDTEYTLLDTPGHVDFSAETERAMRVLDYAILVISGIDGVQSHTETIWNLLRRYKIPTLIFINKMDISSLTKEYLLNQLKCRLSDKIVDFSNTVDNDAFLENIALCSEALMDAFLNEGIIHDNQISNAISSSTVFPCCFGSALKLDGIDTLLSILKKYAVQPNYPEKFGAQIYKITTENGMRLTHMKITGGSLKVKSMPDHNEKVNQIRLYSGAKYTAAEEVFPGTICAVTGLTKTFAGQGIGYEKNSSPPILEPVLSYHVILPPETDTSTALSQLRVLEEEEPLLHVFWNQQLKEIYVQLMGEIQLEVLKTLVYDRFGMNISFDTGKIAYKETISNAVEGIGHYEPLRHYAEVHLLMEPGEIGSGITISADCNEDKLDRNWQRLILSHISEKTHIGVLTGSPVTDIKITLIAGKAHLKHTEGGDFRQATYRAIRMGLKSAQSVLLEPWYDFKIEVPTDSIGHTLSDLQRMDAEFTPPELSGDFSIISGSAPVSAMSGYTSEITSYTHGKGKMSCMVKGYYPCKNQDEIIDQIGYDSDSDIDNPADSIFCSHGSGVVVKWNEVRNKMHVDSGFRLKSSQQPVPAEYIREQSNEYKKRLASDEELMAIFERTYGKIKRPERETMHTRKESSSSLKPHKPINLPKGPGYLLVDGYNIIFAWDELKKIAEQNLDLARSTLINILCNYQGFKQCKVILVFDAYRVKGKTRKIENAHNISVVYTKESETADTYIEKMAHDLGKDYRVRVATSDGAVQNIILGSNAYRVSAEELRREIADVEQAIREYL